MTTLPLPVVLILGWIAGACVTLALYIIFQKPIRRTQAKSHLYANPEFRQWFYENCTQRELQAVDFLVTGQANDSDRACLRKLAGRTPSHISEMILLALGD